MKFSICIPNFNYEKYLGRTLESAVMQSFRDYEITISDNASTDTSLGIIKQYAAANANIRFKVNPCNVGFAGNLDECAGMATGEWMIMLSSDDIITAKALESYNQLINILEFKGQHRNFAISSTFEKIGPDDEFMEYLGPANSTLYSASDIDSELSAQLGCNVYKIAAGELLKRCLTKFYNPFNFAATCYPASVYNNVGGYSGSRMMNPDKWFHWKILAELEFAYFIDKPLFKYRWHPNNQTAQQTQSGALKFYIDEYRSSFEVTPKMLSRSGLSAAQVQSNFVERSILPYAFKHLKKGERMMARRIYDFGKAAYPGIYAKSKRALLLKTLLGAGALGTIIAKSSNR